MSKYIRHNIQYGPEHHATEIEAREYGLDLGKCPECGLDAVIVDYSGVGFVGCPLSHMVYCGNCHPSVGFSGKYCTRKSTAVSRWLHKIRPLAPNQSNLIEKAMEGFGGVKHEQETQN